MPDRPPEQWQQFGKEDRKPDRWPWLYPSVMGQGFGHPGEPPPRQSPWMARPPVALPLAMRRRRAWRIAMQATAPVRLEPSGRSAIYDPKRPPEELPLRYSRSRWSALMQAFPSNIWKPSLRPKIGEYALTMREPPYETPRPHYAYRHVFWVPRQMIRSLPSKFVEMRTITGRRPWIAPPCFASGKLPKYGPKTE